MIVLRCTSKLLARLKTKPEEAPRPSSNLLGDWFATLLHTRRGQYVLAMASKTLLPVVVTGRELRTFPERLASGLAELLGVYGVPTETIERECAAMSEVQYARTNDRSNVGVLIEFQRLLHYDLEDLAAMTPLELSLRLAHTPIVAREAFPEDDTCRFFGVPLLRHRQNEIGN